MSASSTFWLHDKPLVLASQSRIRHEILTRLAVPHLLTKATVNERKLEKSAPGDQVALHLARAKAANVSSAWPDHLVLGADQTLLFENELVHKAETQEQALEQLLRMSGKSHELHTAAAILKNGQVLFETTQIARLKMRRFSRKFAEIYIRAMGESVCATVGGYEIEALGPHVFDEIDGDHYVILGLPILPLLDFFRRSGFCYE